MTLKMTESFRPEADTLVLGLVGTDTEARWAIPSQFRKVDLTVREVAGERCLADSAHRHRTSEGLIEDH